MLVFLAHLEISLCVLYTLPITSMVCTHCPSKLNCLCLCLKYISLICFLVLCKEKHMTKILYLIPVLTPLCSTFHKIVKGYHQATTWLNCPCIVAEKPQWEGFNKCIHSWHQKNKFIVVSVFCSVTRLSMFLCLFLDVPVNQ